MPAVIGEKTEESCKHCFPSKVTSVFSLLNDFQIYTRIFT